MPANQRDIGFVFQNYALFPHLSVFENVAYGLRVQAPGRGPDRRAASTPGCGRSACPAMGDRMINELSGGQQQRVALARAIAIRPRVLLFDEPLSNLDAQAAGADAQRDRRGCSANSAITTIYVTHDQEEAMAISDRIAIMDSGQIAQIGTAEELYLRPASRFVAGFLGSANLLRGTVVAAEPAKTVIDILGHRWELAANSPVAAGRPVDAVIRPEALTLAKQGAGPRGRVESRTYYGDKAEYLVRVGDELIQAVQWNPSTEDAFSDGDQVCVQLPASSVQLLAVD